MGLPIFSGDETFLIISYVRRNVFGLFGKWHLVAVLNLLAWLPSLAVLPVLPEQEGSLCFSEWCRDVCSHSVQVRSAYETLFFLCAYHCIFYWEEIKCSYAIRPPAMVILNLLFCLGTAYPLAVFITQCLSQLLFLLSNNCPCWPQIN